MRKRMSGCIIMTLALVFCVPVMANTAIRAFFGEEEIVFDQPPVIENGRTLVPVRAIMEALGLELRYDQKTQIIEATGGGHEIIMKIGENTARADGEVITLDVPAKIVNNRTLAPLRFVSEALGMDVVWDAPNRMIYISEPSVEAPILQPTELPILQPVETDGGQEVTVTQVTPQEATPQTSKSGRGSKIFSYLGDLGNGLTVSKSGDEGLFFDATDYYDAPDFPQYTGINPIDEYHFMTEQVSIYVYDLQEITEEALSIYVQALETEYQFAFVDAVTDASTGITSNIFANNNCIVVMLPVEAEGLFAIMLTEEQGNRIVETVE